MLSCRCCFTGRTAFSEGSANAASITSMNGCHDIGLNSSCLRTWQQAMYRWLSRACHQNHNFFMQWIQWTNVGFHSACSLGDIGSLWVYLACICWSPALKAGQLTSMQGLENIKDLPALQMTERDSFLGSCCKARGAHSSANQYDSYSSFNRNVLHCSNLSVALSCHPLYLVWLLAPHHSIFVLIITYKIALPSCWWRGQSHQAVLLQTLVSWMMFAPCPVLAMHLSMLSNFEINILICQATMCTMWHPWHRMAKKSAPLSKQVGWLGAVKMLGHRT